MGDNVESTYSSLNSYIVCGCPMPFKLKLKLKYRSILALSLFTLTSFSPANQAFAQGESSFEDASVEHALNNGDYQAAQNLIARRQKTAAKQSLQSAYLATCMMEACLWQGRISEAQSNAKKAGQIIDYLMSGKAALDSSQLLPLKELKTRYLDANAWLLEALGQDAKCYACLDEAIAMMRDLRALDRATWRLSDCLAHKASMEAQNGELLKAKELMEEAIKQAQGSHSISKYTVGDLEENLGGLLYKLGDTQGAQEHFARAVAIKKDSDALQKRFSPHPYWLSPTYRYIKGAPWSSESFEGGLEHRRIDVGRACLEAYLMKDKATGKRAVRVGIKLSNRTDSPLQFLPRKPELFVLNPKIAIGNMLDAASLAQTVETKSAKKAESIRQDGRNATRTMTTYYPNPYNYYNNNGRGRQGFWRSLLSDSGNTGVTQVPDFQAEAQAMQKAQEVEEAGKLLAEEIRKEGVGPCDVPPHGELNGFIFFELKSPDKATKVIFKVPVGDAQFEFRFDALP